MKKIIPGTLLILAFITGRTQVEYGVKAGLNIATWKGEHANDIGDRQSLLHFYGGVLVSIGVSDRFRIQPELLYSGEGVKYDFFYIEPDRQKFAYLNIPILVQYNHPSGFFAETGPQLGLLLSSKLGDGNTFVDNKHDFKKTDIKWLAGIGYRTGFGAGINLRYNMGLTELYDQPNLKVKNSVISIGLFYFLNIKK